MRHATSALLVFTLFSLPLAADQKTGAVVIKSFGILGPVTGGREVWGWVEVEVTGPKFGSLVVELQSSNPAIAAVPLTVTPTQGRAAFVVKTSPVTSPNDVTITAHVGASSKKAALHILPPKLSSLGCDQPTNVVPQKPLKCTASLDGIAAESIAVDLSTSMPVASVPARVTIPPGASKETFQVKAQPIAQSASVLVLGAYAGVTKSVPVTVLPVALESLTLPNSTVVGGQVPKCVVKLTAPPPASGLVVKISSQVVRKDTGTPAVIPNSTEPLLVIMPNSITVTHEEQAFDIVTYPVRSTTLVTITASSDLLNAGDLRQATLRINPAPLDSVHIDPDHFSNVPLGGQQATVMLELLGLAPTGGAPVDIRYSGDTQITGPAQVVMPAGSLPSRKHFAVTVSPCSVQPTCTVVITARYLGSEKQASATVTK